MPSASRFVAPASSCHGPRVDHQSFNSGPAIMGRRPKKKSPVTALFVFLVAASWAGILLANYRFYFDGLLATGSISSSICFDVAKVEALLWNGRSTSASATDIPIPGGDRQLPNPLIVEDAKLMPRGEWDQVDLVIGILSGRDNFERRAKIRDTWKKDLVEAMAKGKSKADVRMKPIFLVGANYCEIPVDHRSAWFRCDYNCTARNCEDETIKQLHLKEETNKTNKIYEEASEHGDMLLLNMKDYYHNSPHKIATYMAWAATATSASAVMKIDDDIFLDWRIFEQEYTRVLASHGNSSRPFWWGRMRPMEYVYREGNDRWMVTKEQFPNDIYPPFMSGVGSVMHIDAARFIARSYPHLHHKLFGEDVALGVWLGGSNIQYINDPDNYPYAPGFLNDCDKSRSLLFFETCMMEILRRYSQNGLAFPKQHFNAKDVQVSIARAQNGKTRQTIQQ